MTLDDNGNLAIQPNDFVEGKRVNGLGAGASAWIGCKDGSDIALDGQRLRANTFAYKYTCPSEDELTEVYMYVDIGERLSCLN